MIFNESNIMKRCQRGELSAFTRIYDRYFKKIYDFIYYKTLNRESAEDITSTTFLKAIEKVDTFDSDRGSVRSWLFKIAENSVKDFFKKQKHELDIDDVWELSCTDNIEDLLIRNDAIDNVRHFLQLLPEKKRDIVIYRVWQGMSYNEIADITGMSTASCKMSYYRTIEELKSKVPYTGALLLVFILFAFLSK